MTFGSSAEQHGNAVEEPPDCGRPRPFFRGDQVDNDTCSPIDDVEPLGRGGGAAGSREPRRRHAPRLADRRGASRHDDGAQVADAAEPGEVGEEELTTPQRAVRPEAEAVEAHGEHGFDATVLDHARRGVGVMVLDADQRTIEIEGELRREVFRVKVVGDEVGDHAVERRQVIDGLEKRRVGGHVFEVADVMAGNHLAALGHGHRVLQLGADGKDSGARRIEREGERLGSVTTRPAQQLHSSGHCPRHGVVAADVDRAIVAEQPVGQRTQPGDGVVVRRGQSARR